jgi:protein-disulfide isomerase
MHRNATRQFHKLIALSSYLIATCALASDPASDAVVAKVGHETISYAQLQKTIQDTLDKQQTEHEAQLQELKLSFVRARQEYIESELGKMVDQRILELEAAARKTTPAALKAATKAPSVTDAQEHSFYDSQKPQITQSFAQIEPKIKQFLQNQADEQLRRKYLDSLRAKYRAYVTMDPLREQIDAFGPQRGPAAAPVTIVEFSDFQCPYCGRFTPVLKQVLAAYPTQVRLVYEYFPLSTIHPDAQKAAEAAACANNQGKFWEMHDTLFAEQSSLDIDALKDKAKRLGLDTKQFDDCLDGGLAGAVVAADVAAGQRLGIGATPVSFVNGRFVNGTVTLEQMSALIEDELHRSPSTAIH